jgi:hypothetical protein
LFNEDMDLPKHSDRERDERARGSGEKGEGSGLSHLVRDAPDYAFMAEHLL